MKPTALQRCKIAFVEFQFARHKASLPNATTDLLLGQIASYIRSLGLVVIETVEQENKLFFDIHLARPDILMGKKAQLLSDLIEYVKNQVPEINGIRVFEKDNLAEELITASLYAFDDEHIDENEAYTSFSQHMHNQA